MDVPVLPQSAQFSANRLSKLPAECTNVQSVLTPTNGSSFTQTQQLIFDFPTSGCIVPESLCIRNKMTAITAGAATGGNTSIVGGAGYAWITRADWYCGSKLVMSSPNYNTIYDKMMKFKMNQAQRCSAATCFGWSTKNLAGGATATAQQLNNLNGYALPQAAGTNVISTSCPLMGIMSSAEKLIPAFCMEQWRLILTVDSNSNYLAFGGTGQTVSSITLSNVEVVYDTVHFGGAYESMVRQMPPFFIKSSGYASFSQSIGASAGGSNIDLTFQVNRQSIRALFLLMQNSAATALNKGFDSFDVTSKAALGGSYQFYIDSKAYPQRPLDTFANKSGALLELRNAVYGSSHDQVAYNMSITPAEYEYLSSDTTTAIAPANFVVGTSLEKVGGLDGFALNGISARNTPVMARITCNGANDALTALLLAYFDYIIVINPQTKQCDFEA